MHPFIYFFNVKIPLYGLMVATGLVVSNLLLSIPLLKKKESFSDFLVLESYAFGGAILGGKLFYILSSIDKIEWNKLSDEAYLSSLIMSGYVFYGALILGLLFFFIAGKIHHINAKMYLKQAIFAVPICHAFGRVGCFFAGCCFGMPYNGPFSVKYPHGVPAPADVSLLPIQLIEAFCLLAISLIIFIVYYKLKIDHSIELYLILYSILRFVLEFFRYDSYRGIYLGVSFSQWISIGLFILGILAWIITSKRERYKN